MEVKRFERAPALLLAMASAAIGLSWLLSRHEVAQQSLRLCDNPRPQRASGQLNWPMLSLPPLELASAPEVSAGDSPVWSSFSITVVPYREGESMSFRSESLLATNRLASGVPYKPAAPTADQQDGRLILLVPAKPLRVAGEIGPIFTTKTLRNNWSVFGVDSLSVASHSGRLLADAMKPAAQAEPSSVPRRLPPIQEPPVHGPVVQGPVLLPEVDSQVTPAKKKIEIKAGTITSYLSRTAVNDSLPTPLALGQQLDRVAESRDAAPWAWAVAYRLRTLAATPIGDAAAVRSSLEALRETAMQGAELADESAAPEVATELRRARWAIERRVTTWVAAHEQGIQLAKRSEDLLAGARWAMSESELGASLGMTLSDSSRPVAAAPLNLVAKLEDYERSPSAAAARLIAIEAQRLAESQDKPALRLADSVERNYRNANLRVSIAGDLVQRMLPTPEPVVMEIRDRIAGAPVRGRSVTETKLGVKLLPDERAWRVGLEARGVVTSSTYSRGGPAVLRSKGKTTFTATKQLIISGDSILTKPALAKAKGGSQLVGLSTSYDRVPFIGSYARSSARSEYGRRYSRANNEMRTKVERRVSSALDAKVAPLLTKLEQQYKQGVLGRVETLGMSVDPLEMRTTEERMIGRVRIACKNQLAAHTPRMRAPSDSLMSLQMHESLLNNALEKLELSGQRLTAAQLRERLTEKLDLEPEADLNPNDAKTIIRFAKEDPVRVSFDDGYAKLTLSINEMIVRGSRHRNFRVHTRYAPEAYGLEAELVQQGTPQIEGRMRTASRIRLHGALGKVLGEDRRIPLVRLPENAPEHVREALKQLATNQLVIEDGWFGVAVGPQRNTQVAIQVGRYVR